MYFLPVAISFFICAMCEAPPMSLSEPMPVLPHASRALLSLQPSPHFSEAACCRHAIDVGDVVAIYGWSRLSKSAPRCLTLPPTQIHTQNRARAPVDAMMRYRFCRSFSSSPGFRMRRFSVFLAC